MKMLTMTAEPADPAKLLFIDQGVLSRVPWKAAISRGEMTGSVRPVEAVQDEVKSVVWHAPRSLPVSGLPRCFPAAMVVGVGVCRVRVSLRPRPRP
jgi:hypothetical protein